MKTGFYKIKASRATLLITEQELMALFQKDPELLATCLKRGKTYLRRKQRENRRRDDHE